MEAVLLVPALGHAVHHPPICLRQAIRVPTDLRASVDVISKKSCNIVLTDRKSKVASAIDYQKTHPKDRSTAQARAASIRTCLAAMVVHPTLKFSDLLHPSAVYIQNLFSKYCGLLTKYKRQK